MGRPMKPLIPLHSREFKYVPSTSTDIRKTFARIRREMAKQTEAKVLPLKKERA